MILIVVRKDLTVEKIKCSLCYMLKLKQHLSDFVSQNKRFRPPRFILMSLLLASPLAVLGQEEPPPDKWRYNLFHPTPRQEMREMNTDRPDQTESPFTVDAGHFQLEMDFVSGVFERERAQGADVTTEIWNVTPVNFKVGLLNNVDLQLVLDTYVQSKIRDHVSGTVDNASGFGDATSRLKVNLWGNDGGRTAFAIMPVVKWPLPKSGLRNGKTEGGVIFPLSVDLGEGFDLGAMTEFDFVANEAGRYDTEFVNSVTVGHDLTQKLAMYVEFFTVTGSAPGFRWQGQADVGWIYALQKNVQLDCGCNFGVTRSAPDFGPFAGLSIRF